MVWNVCVKQSFVQVFTLAGIPIAAGIINFVVLTSAASAGNSGLFSTSRMLYNLGNNKQASPAFAKLNKNSVPSNALVISAIVVSVGALLSKLMPENAFSIVTTISAICFIWVWSIIIISHIIYKRKTVPYMKLQSSKHRWHLLSTMSYLYFSPFY